MCTCRPCYLLFTEQGAGGGKYVAVPDRYLYDPEFSCRDAQWEELQIPVKMAFFFVNSELDKTVAFYPSPAGATESLLPLDTWADVLAANPLCRRSLDPDVEALIVYRRGRAYECWLVPIDACYELVGHVRLNWKGFDGGQEAWEAIDGFFASLRARSPAGERRACERARLRLRRRQAGAVRRGADHRLQAPGRGDHRAAVHCLALRIQIRIEPLKRRYSDAKAERLVDLFGERARWGDTMKPHAVRQRRRAGAAASPVRRTSTCPCRSPTTSRWPPPSSSTASRTARSRCSSSSPARCSSRVRPGSRRRAGALAQGGLLSAAGQGVAGAMDLHFPDSTWLRLRRDTLRHLQRYKSRLAVPTWEDDRGPPLPPGNEPGSNGNDEPARAREHRRRPPIADTVLYEGYLLYPYRAVAREERRGCAGSSGCWCRSPRRANRSRPAPCHRGTCREPWRPLQPTECIVEAVADTRSTSGCGSSGCRPASSSRPPMPGPTCRSSPGERRRPSPGTRAPSREFDAPPRWTTSAPANRNVPFELAGSTTESRRRADRPLPARRSHSGCPVAAEAFPAPTASPGCGSGRRTSPPGPSPRRPGTFVLPLHVATHLIRRRQRG